jgi:hypothetical protein
MLFSKNIKGATISLGVAISLLAVGSTTWAQYLSPMTTFGGGDGWRAPNEVLVGDTAGTDTAGAYNYLKTGLLERGLAYNSCYAFLF